MQAMEHSEQGKLYVVATPIGNLGDITFRAINILQSVDLILSEDTRVAKKLLTHYEITTPTISYHAHSNKKRESEIITRLQSGESMALITDAGTPGISDPGEQLVRELQKQSGNTIAIIPIPGASAVTALLSVSGSSTTPFTFLGFLPHKKGREKIFQSIKDSSVPTIFYESPHRIMKTLERLSEVLDASYRVVIGRELTKLHEEIISGTPTEILRHFLEHPDRQRGEFVVYIEH